MKSKKTPLFIKRNSDNNTAFSFVFLKTDHEYYLKFKLKIK